MGNIMNCMRDKRIIFGAFLAFALLFSNTVLAKKNVEESFVLWKDTKYHRFFIDKNVDFSKYKKMAVLPLDYSSMIVSPKTKKKMERNWSNFKQEGMPDVVTFFDSEFEDVFDDSDAFSLTKTSGDDVLIVQYKAIEISPKAFIDNALGTVGMEALNRVASVQYQVAIYDARTKAVVAMIEDDFLVSIQVESERVLNNRANHRRAWKTSLHKLAKSFNKNMIRLQEKSK